MLNKINHYSLTTNATIYDEEAMTALQLAGRTAQKVNECVDAVNNMEQSFPETIADEVQKNINNGTFTEAINHYVGNMKARLENLLGRVSEGSTTMDAEVIDSRTDLFGNIWENAGNSTRGQIGEIINRLEQIADPSFEELVNLPLSAGYYDYLTGIYTPHTSYESVRIAVKAGEVFTTSALYGFNASDGVVLDASGNYIRYYRTNAGGNVTSNFDNIMVIPERGAFLCVNSLASHGLRVRKLTGYRVNTAEIEQYVENIVEAVSGGGRSIELSGVTHTGYVVNANGEMIPVNNNATNYEVLEVPVKAGDIIRIKATTHHTNGTHAFLNANGGVVRAGDIIDGTTLTTTEKTLLVPIGASSVLVAGHVTAKATAHKIVDNGKTASGVKWVCMGDSLTERNQRTTKNYHDYVSDKLDLTVINMGVSGTGYKAGESASGAFYQRVTSIPTDADVVTIFGSGNDLTQPLGVPTDTGTDTLCGCINTTIDNIQKRVPAVQLGIVSPCPWGDYPPADGNNKMSLYAEALRMICTARGIPFLDLYHCSGLRPWDTSFLTVAYTKDEGNSVHPDETGHKMIASQFYSFMQQLISTY